MKFQVLDLFSGLGGFSLGLERTGGFETVAFCEIDPYCRRVLAKHWPDVPCHDDVTTRQFTQGEADVICGGFPCQDISNAGKGAGLSGERSGLYRELVRAIRVVRPLYAIVENVAALLGSGMGTVLGDLAEIGVDTEWDCVPAQAVGACHERDRVWIVAHAADTNSSDRWTINQACRRTEGQNSLFQGKESPSCSEGLSSDASHAQSLGCGSWGARRPPDSFARIRDEARRNAADPNGARLSFGQGFGKDPQHERSPSQRDAIENVRQSIWPDEPALLGVDDGLSEDVDSIKAIGNTILPKIPELIGRAILEQCAQSERAA